MRSLITVFGTLKHRIDRKIPYKAGPTLKSLSHNQKFIRFMISILQFSGKSVCCIPVPTIPKQNTSAN